ncbi:hypothetical protein [Aquihabitans sp. McL0605]|uniref:hypothetical protein n=1 Tax=Aquihabitans sp. McL0605 TaxID=3415671 RepID=UPI003CF21FDE
MLFPAPLWPRIASGEVTVAFRSWKRPTVKAGGTLITPAGQLAIDRVEVVDAAKITRADARRAGFDDADAVRTHLGTDPDPDPDRQAYRVRFHLLGDDPRIALRADDHLSADDRALLDRKLAGLDQRSPTGPWTTATLAVIRDHPAVVSTDLAERLGDERPRFKLRVRRLKALGLTESLEVGYRLSPRGATYLAGDPTAPGG